jgi:WG containing repeat
MKAASIAITFVLLSFLGCWSDESDVVMPELVAKAPVKAEVLMRYIDFTGECFPDPSAKVRFQNGKVMLSDFQLYEEREARLSEGLVAFSLDGKWGACDKDGRVVLPATYESPFEFHEGLAGVDKDGKHGFINKKGDWVIEPTFDNDFTCDFIGAVCAVTYKGKCAVIDKKGQFVWKPGLIRSENLAGGLFIETADGHSGFLDDSGNLIPDQQPNSRYFNSR